MEHPALIYTANRSLTHEVLARPSAERRASRRRLVWLGALGVVLATAASAQNYTYLRQFGGYGTGDGKFNMPSGVAIDPISHNIVVGDSINNRVQIFSSDGTYLGQFGQGGIANGQFSNPMGIAIDPSSRNILVVDRGNYRVQVFDHAGTFLRAIGIHGGENGQFGDPSGIAIDPTNHGIAVTDGGRVQLFDGNFVFLTSFVLHHPPAQFGVAIDPQSHRIAATGYEYNSGYVNNRVEVFDADGSFLFEFGPHGQLSGELYGSRGLAIDNESHNIIVADTENRRVQIFDSSGQYVNQFGYQGSGDGQFEYPWGVAVDPVGHNIVVTDKLAHRIQVFAPQLQVTTASWLPNSMVGSAYSVQLAAVGGTGGNTWSVAGGSLPPGLALSSAGVISGAPTASGDFTSTLQVTDSASNVAQAFFTIRVNPMLAIATPSPLSAGMVKEPYSLQLAASGGAAGYSWSITSGTLPSGVSLNISGALSGTPTASGDFTFTAAVIDSASNATQGTFSVHIYPEFVISTATSLPVGTVGKAYTAQLVATGGAGGYTWSLVGGLVPTGTSLSSAGTLAGTATASGDFSFTARVTDGVSNAVQKSFSVHVNPTLVLTSTSPLTSGTIGVTYSTQLAATGGAGGYVWSAPDPGTLPPGVVLSSSGLLSGTPSASGDFAFPVNVRDSSATTAQGTFSLHVFSVLAIDTAATLPGGTVGKAYSVQLGAHGGAGSYVWQVMSGLVPTGLILNSAGLLSGPPGASGDFTFTAQVTDGAANKQQKTFLVQVIPALVVATTSPLVPGTVGVGYSVQLVASGGTGGYVWAAVSPGALPAGLTLGSNGLLLGTPTASGDFTFTAKVTDSEGNVVQEAFNLRIYSALVLTAPWPLPLGMVNSAYFLQLNTQGGAGGNTWSMIGGSLPNGVSLGATGLISGTPTESGDFTFTVRVTDSAANAATTTYIIHVNPELVINTASPLPHATHTLPYSFQVVAVGGSGGYAWEVVLPGTGALPDGLLLSTAGFLSGSPTATGDFPFTVVVTDSVGITTQTNLTLTVRQCAPTITAEPRRTEILSGLTATLSVTAIGVPTLAYQWYQGPTGDTSTPVGTDSSTYTTPPLTATTPYWVQVTNACGHTDSTTAVVDTGAVPLQSLWVPVASHAKGLANSQWRTDVGVLNASPYLANIELRLHTAAGVVSGTQAVAPGEQVLLTDVARQVSPAFSGSAALEVLADQQVRVTSRTYNLVAADATCYPDGTQGQGYPAFAASDGLALGEIGYLPGLAESAAYRTNIGLVNASVDEATVLVELFDEVGTKLTDYTVVLAAGEWKQETQPFKTKARRTNLERCDARVTILVGTRVLAFASIIDNITNDPTTVETHR